MRSCFLRFLAALLLAVALPGVARAEMSDAERDAFRAEVRAYLMEHPEILTEMVALLEERQHAETAKNDQDLVATHSQAIFEDGFSFVGGNPEGGFTVVEFLDYQCGFCRRAHPEFQELITADGDIRWIVKELPILGPGSELAARAAVATLMQSGPEAYRALNDGLMRLEGQVTDASLDGALTAAGVDPAAIRAKMEDPEVTRRLEATQALARDLAIQGTPSFIFENRLVRGYVPLPEMRGLVEELRASN